ncbi:MAG: hypothetical protein ABL973_17545 [Micropepsaceae bacterium]
MRKFTVMGASALVALRLTGAAIAADDPMAGTYGNTVVVTTAQGDISKIRINRDGTYKAQGTDGKSVTGKWAMRDNNTKYCSMPDLPATASAGAVAPKEMCSEFKGAHRVGDKWQQKDSEGQTIAVEIKADD